MLSEKIAKEFLKKSAELQHLNCWCDGCAKRLAECVNIETLAIDAENVALKTTLADLRATANERTKPTLEPGTTYLAGTPAAEVDGS